MNKKKEVTLNDIQIQINEYFSFQDEYLSEIHKEIKTKLDGLKSEIDAVHKVLNVKVLDLLKQTWRGRLFCKLLGLKNERAERKRQLKRLKKQRRKER